MCRLCGDVRGRGMLARRRAVDSACPPSCTTHNTGTHDGKHAPSSSQKTTTCSNNLFLAAQESPLLAWHVSRVSLAINRRCSVHLELLAPKDLYVAMSLVGGVKGGRRVDVIAQVRASCLPLSIRVLSSTHVIFHAWSSPCTTDKCLRSLPEITV